MNQMKKGGILLAISSLPSSYGVGDFGKNAYHFVDLLSEGGFSLWQILPLNPLGYGHSPYQPFSSFAIDEIYMDLDALHKEGLIKEPKPYRPDIDRTDYEGARAYKLPLLREAFKKELAEKPNLLKDFMKKNPWVKDYAAFRVFKEENGGVCWDQWPLKDQQWVEKRPSLTGKRKEEFDFHVYLQYKLYQQWDKLHAYANDNGIQIIGDVPFYVGFDSADVWGNQDTFLLDPESKQPTFIAGVPPDYFSETGQRWGNPLYDWDKLAKEDFAFVQNRILLNAKIYDIVRLDHFRAFDTFWKIPASCETAIDGEWVEAPGYALFDSLFKKAPSLSLIAEDLGDLRPEVLTLRDHYSLPGMNVIEFTFGPYELEHDGDWDAENSVAYLGTHDNDTMLSYFYELEDMEQAKWVLALQNHGIDGGTMVDRMIRYCLAKRAKFAVLAMQDILELDGDCRMNVPSTVNDINWTWKMKDFDAFQAKLPRLAILLHDAGRSTLG